MSTTSGGDGGTTETITLLSGETIEEGPYDIRLTDDDGDCDDVDPASLVPPATLVTPVDELSTFDGQPVAANWTLTVTDESGGDGIEPTLTNWYLGVAPERCFPVIQLRVDVDCVTGYVDLS